MKKRTKKKSSRPENVEPDRQPTPAVRRSVQRAPVTTPPTFTGSEIAGAYAGAVICPVPVDESNAGEEPVWMSRLHETFPYLRGQWERARRRPDRSEPERTATVLAHATGATPAKLVVYVAYNRRTVDSILHALARAATFAALCGVRSIATANPGSMGTISCAEAVTETLRRMAHDEGLRVIVHNSTHKSNGAGN